jgi:glycosyltransferase involved in cell wall biosynthesis
MRFSVIVPLYNKAPYVEKALQSVLAQTFIDYELIVVDDGSTDGSADIAARVLTSAQKSLPSGGDLGDAPASGEDQGEAFFLIRQSNTGVSTARNNGVAASHGDYLCFLDADDWWAHTFLEEMDRFIDAYPDAGIWGTNYYYVKNGRQHVPLNISSGYFNYCMEYASHMSMPLTSISVAISRFVFDKTGGFKPHLKLGEDFDVWIRIALKYKVAFLNKPLSYYNQDVDVTQRGVGHLQEPAYHMLWNLDYLEDEERTNPAYKQLIDNLRVYGLKPYFISQKYHVAAVEQLAKVDWSLQPANERRYYRCPLWYLRAHQQFMKAGSVIKQWLIKKKLL